MDKLLEKIYCLIEPYLRPREVANEIIPLTKNQDVTGEHGVSFKNTGTVNATINSFPLDAGDPMITFTVARNERDRTKYRITFDGAGVGTKQIWMIRKKRT